ncbi:MAG TPA: hypothetical protein VFY39_09925 [Gammaproteobacteria bacterium]|nr:hypothetical protein [Gammaproteobacteria bacterium]
MSQQSDPRIPILRDAVGRQAEPGTPSAADALIAELQTRLAAECFALTESTLRRAFAEMEANLLEQISTRLRQALPELIDTVLREQLESGARLDPIGAPEEGAGTNDSEG